MTMDLKGRAENRTRSRVSSFFFLSLGRYMNRTEVLAHLTISTRNHWDADTNREINMSVSHNSTAR